MLICSCLLYCLVVVCYWLIFVRLQLTLINDAGKKKFNF